MPRPYYFPKNFNGLCSTIRGDLRGEGRIVRPKNQKVRLWSFHPFHPSFVVLGECKDRHPSEALVALLDHYGTRQGAFHNNVNGVVPLVAARAWRVLMAELGV